LGSDHPVLGGRDPREVVVGVVDADGRLDPRTLKAVEPYSADPAVGGVQIGVPIANASAGLLARLQDIEFVGFSAFVQTARGLLGSVGLGGNGQFNRLSALLQGPWAAGWARCPDRGFRSWPSVGSGRVAAAVLSRGLSRPAGPKQPPFPFAPADPLATRPHRRLGRVAKGVPCPDLGVHQSGPFDLLVDGSAGLFPGLLGGGFGASWSRSSTRPTRPATPVRLFFSKTLSPFSSPARPDRLLPLLPTPLPQPLRIWQLPATVFCFALYAYLWPTVLIRALVRIATRRKGWAKKHLACWNRNGY
jgi:1,2-diacylglycerol 3-beta-glucosyltransferase